MWGRANWCWHGFKGETICSRQNSNGLIGFFSYTEHSKKKKQNKKRGGKTIFFIGAFFWKHMENWVKLILNKKTIKNRLGFGWGNKTSFILPDPAWFENCLSIHTLFLWFQVALGDSNELLDADYEASNLPDGKNSIKGLGQTGPDPKNALTL